MLGTTLHQSAPFLVPLNCKQKYASSHVYRHLASIAHVCLVDRPSVACHGDSESATATTSSTTVLSPTPSFSYFL